MRTDAAQIVPVRAAGPAGPRAGIKTRRTALGTHVFDRRTGMNLFIDQPRDGEPARLAPRQVSVALTNACDLRCSYCYAPKSPGRHDTTTVVAWAKELDTHGCFGVGFGGGEPTLLTGFPELCQLIAAQTAWRARPTAAPAERPPLGSLKHPLRRVRRRDGQAS